MNNSVRRLGQVDSIQQVFSKPAMKLVLCYVLRTDTSLSGAKVLKINLSLKNCESLHCIPETYKSTLPQF